MWPSHCLTESTSVSPTAYRAGGQLLRNCHGTSTPGGLPPLQLLPISRTSTTLTEILCLFHALSAVILRWIPPLMTTTSPPTPNLCLFTCQWVQSFAFILSNPFCWETIFSKLLCQLNDFQVGLANRRLGQIRRTGGHSVKELSLSPYVSACLFHSLVPSQAVSSTCPLLCSDSCNTMLALLEGPDLWVITSPFGPACGSGFPAFANLKITLSHFVLCLLFQLWSNYFSI